MNSTSRRPTGMILKKRPIPMFQRGGAVGSPSEPDKTVSDLLKYLSEYGQLTIPGQGLDIDPDADPDIETNRGRRVSPEESAELDAQEAAEEEAARKANLTPTQRRAELDDKMYKSSEGRVGKQALAPLDPLPYYGKDITPPSYNPGYIGETPKPLRGLRTQGQTVDQKKDADAKAAVSDAAFEAARFMPILGEAIDAGELAKVAATGKDFYGEERDPAMFAALTAAGYVIPNALEKPLKSAWRAMKKFPSISKRQLNELPADRREAILGNLVTAHDEVYKQSGVTNGILLPEDLQWVRNVRQLPSLMSGSKLENSVGKDGMIKISEIENLINNKNTSEAERNALQAALKEAKKQEGLTPRGTARLEGGKLDYNDFRQLASFQSSYQFGIKETDQYATYGLNNLDINTHGNNAVGYDWSGWNPRTKLISTADPDLISTEYGHFGEDVIGHYRSFERTDEKGVLYISEMQSDPMQAKGPEGGVKEVSLPGARRHSDAAAETQMGYAAETIAHDKKMLAELDNVNSNLDMARWQNKNEDAQTQLLNGPKTQAELDDFLQMMSTHDGPKTQAELDDFHRRSGHGNTFLGGGPEGVRTALEEKIALTQAYHDGLAGGWRGGLNAKQASLIKNQDQFLISQILEAEAKGAERIRFPTGETTGSIQGYRNQTQRISRAKSDVSLYENISKEARENELTDKTFKEHPMFKGKSDDEIYQEIEQLPGYVEPRFQSDEHKKVMEEYAQGFKNLGGDDNATRKAVYDWYDATKNLRSSREHLSRINSSSQAQLGIMKGYDDLPKALKKHGLEAKKVLDDADNTWWEVETPAKLGAGAGEIRAFKEGGRFRILKKQL